MENGNNNINNAQQAAPQQPVQQAAPQQYQQPYQQPVQQAAPQQYQQPYQQQYQQTYPQGQQQYAAYPYPVNQNLSGYDMMAPDEKAARKKKANILCFISLGLHFVPEIISGIFTAIMESISKSAGSSDITSTISMIMASLVGGTYIASWVLMIIARVKYKESKFAKVLMWVYIGILALYVIAAIVVIATCAYILKDCQGF